MTNHRGIRVAALLLAASTAIATGGEALAQCTGTWLDVSQPNSPSNRQNHAMAYDASRGVTVLFGGYRGGFGFNNETWEWDGKSWTNIVPKTGSPDARGNFGMAYDSARQKIVLYGGAGLGGLAYGDTWEYDASGWTLVAPANSPTPRFNHAMAYDEARGVMVIHGGFSTQRWADTWTYDGSTWTQAATTGLTGRNGHSMTYDASRERIVAFGGFNGARLSDTWEWDGAAWVQQVVAGPSGRQYLAMGYDSDRGMVVLFGGQIGPASGDRESDTWEYDGAAWTLVGESGSGATFRDQHAMSYDPIAGNFVMFGGYAGGSNVLFDTWLYMPGAMPEITLQPEDQFAAVGGSVSFTALAEGPGDITYLWAHDGVALKDGGAISGATTPTLTINPVNGDHAGIYTVLISNSCGELTSEEARLVVKGGCRIDWNEDGAVNSQDFFDFLTDFFANDADFNNDNDTNSQDFFDFLVLFFKGC